MNYIESKAREDQCWCEKSNKWTYQLCVHRWEKIGQKFILNLFANIGAQMTELAWKSINNNMSSRGIF